MNISRRGFLASAAAAAAVPAVEAAETGKARKSGPRGGRNRCPYRGIDWSRAVQIKGTSHIHCTTQADLEIILKRGIEFLTLSNYYPSAPWFPLSKMTENHWILHHDWPVRDSRTGELVNGPFDWNAIVSKWRDELPPEIRAKFPFKEGGRIFRDLPPNVIEGPNAEHHSFLPAPGDRNTVRGLHMNGLGSLLRTGTFDKHHKLVDLRKHTGYTHCMFEYWKTAIDRILAELIVPDGGGVTINHPTWSQLDRALILDLLDWDPRVLGMEVLEAGYNSEHYWDWVLATGRQCFGFFVPDWSIDKEVFGVNVLLAKERTVEACLRAYRQGNFYGAAHGLGELGFTSIGFDGRTVTASVDRPARLEIRTARGTVKEVRGTEIAWTVPEHRPWQGAVTEVFARVKAYSIDGKGEELFSQPFMLGGHQAIW